jgi:hypothetical protein
MNEKNKRTIAPPQKKQLFLGDLTPTSLLSTATHVAKNKTATQAHNCHKPETALPLNPEAALLPNPDSRPVHSRLVLWNKHHQAHLLAERKSRVCLSFPRAGGRFVLSGLKACKQNSGGLRRNVRLRLAITSTKPGDFRRQALWQRRGGRRF